MKKVFTLFLLSLLVLFMGGSTATAAPDDRPAHIVGHVRNSATGEFLPHVLVSERTPHFGVDRCYGAFYVEESSYR